MYNDINGTNNLNFQSNIQNSTLVIIIRGGVGRKKVKKKM